MFGFVVSGVGLKEVLGFSSFRWVVQCLRFLSGWPEHEVGRRILRIPLAGAFCMPVARLASPSGGLG